MKKLLLTAVAAGALVGGASVASASIIDFTDDDAYFVQSETTASGFIDGIEWTITPSVTPLTYTKPGPGGPGIIEPLAGDNDGIGIIDDELSTTESTTQFVTLSFSQEVTITGVAFLDLFEAVQQDSNEVALLYAGVGTGGTLLEEFEAMEMFQTNFGYMATETSAPYTGTAFTFAAALSNDNVGVADYALAGVQIAPIPLPAGALLLGTALGGLGLMRRRKAKAS